MNLFGSALAVTAAAVLVTSQPALAVQRAPAASGESEALAGHPGTGLPMAAIAVVALISLLMLIDGDDDDRPTSP